MRQFTRNVVALALATSLAGLPGALAETRLAHADEPIDAGSPRCLIEGSPIRYAPVLSELGLAGDPFVSDADPGYWGGRGYRFQYERADKRTFLTAPEGGYLAGGIVLASDADRASVDLDDARAGWLRDWEAMEPVDGATIGDASVVLQHATPWEVTPGRRMTEVFVAFRMCNASAHLLVAVMPDFEPIMTARRYAEAIAQRMSSEAVLLARPLPTVTADTSASSGSTPSLPGSRCAISGDLGLYAPTLAEFGRGGGAFAVPGNYGYWDGRGYGFGFERFGGEEFQASPWGGYLFGGLLRADDEKAARRDFDDALAGWTRGWDQRRTTEVDASPIADQSVVLTRPTPWEVDHQQPMVEVFVSFRRCNVNVHYVLTVMPRFEPVQQALRYAYLIDERLQR